MDVDEIKNLSAYELASIAGCFTPDSPDSAGATFLNSVRDSVVEAIGYGQTMDDARIEIADDAPAVYAATRWAEFVDLGAYQEEPEADEWPSSLTDAAGVALYQIADRLIGNLWESLEESDDDDESGNGE